MKTPFFTLYNNVEIPAVGIGMDQVKDFDKGYNALMCAFENGYRSIDTAFSYGNEEMVGKAIKDSGIARKELFVTTKLVNSSHGYDEALRGFERSVKRLGVDYLDSYLIHWPGKYLYVETWKAFERLYSEGLVRAIGVCNFTIHHLETLLANSEMAPMMNQLEWHPYYGRHEIAQYCQAHNILIEAWSPLMCGAEVLEDKTILMIADEVKKTPAQVILRWHFQNNRRVFPRSVTPSRIKENIQLFDFELNDAQMGLMNDLEKHELRIGPNPDVFFENY